MTDPHEPVPGPIDPDREPQLDLSPVAAPDPDPEVDPTHEHRGSESGDFRRYGRPLTDEEFEAMVERRS